MLSSALADTGFPPMNIACVAATDVRSDPGAACRSRALAHARALADAGHQVTLFGVLSPGAEPEEDHGPVVIVRTAVGGETRDPLQLSGAWAMAGATRRLRPVIDAALARGRPDMVHAFGVDIAGPAAAAARRVGAAFVLDDAGETRADVYARSVNARDQGVRRRLLRRVVGFLHRRADRVQRRVRSRGLAMAVTSTPQLAADLLHRYGGPEPLVVRDCFPAVRSAAPHQLRVRLGTFPVERILVFRGGDGPGSGAEAAVRALRILGDGHVLVFVGPAGPSDAVERVARDCGVTDRLRYLADVPERELVELLASADAALIPGEPVDRVARLTLPPVIFECMAAGVPIAASDLPAVGALVRDTGAGVLYTARRPTDPGALAEAVRTLLIDPSLAATCRDRALTSARSELSWGRESQKLVEAYEHAL